MMKTIIILAMIIGATIVQSECYGEIKLSPRTESDVVVENKGTCPIVSAKFPFYIVGNVEQTWNLETEGKGNGAITIFNNVPAGTTYQGAGLIVSNYTTFSYHSSASPVTCAC